MNLLEALEDLQDEPEKEDDIGDMPGQFSFFPPLTQNQIRNIGENIERRVRPLPNYVDHFLQLIGDGKEYSPKGLVKMITTRDSEKIDSLMRVWENIKMTIDSIDKRLSKLIDSTENIIR